MTVSDDTWLAWQKSIWGPLVSQKAVEIHCDNTGAVSAINKGSSKDKTGIHLLRCLWFFVALFKSKSLPLIYQELTT